MVFQYGDTEVIYLMGKDKRMAEFIPVIGHVERTVDSDLFSSVVHHIISRPLFVTRWRNTMQHRMSQKEGRAKLFESSKITVCKAIREYSDTDREQAPADSNTYMGV